MDSVRDAILAGLYQDAAGLWRTQAANDAVSYPDDGHAACAAVEDGSFWFAHRNAVILDLLARHRPQSSLCRPLLDVGGGNGFVAKALQDAGIEVVLVEPGITGALNARRRGIRNVVNATAQALNPPRSIPVNIGMFDVLEHIEDDVGLLSALGAWMDRDSALFLTVPAFQVLWSSEDRAAGHYRRYTRASLGRVLAASGFEVEFASCFFSFLYAPIFMFRTLPTLLGLAAESRQAADVQKDHPPPGVAVRLMCNIDRWLVRHSCCIVGSSIACVARPTEPLTVQFEAETSQARDT